MGTVFSLIIERSIIVVHPYVGSDYKKIKSEKCIYAVIPVVKGYKV